MSSTTIVENPAGTTGKPPVVYTSKSAHLVEDIRRRFFQEEWPQNQDLYCEQDVERVRQSEWFVKRFLLVTRRNVDEAYQMLKTALRWRKSINLPNMKSTDFPKEFYEIGGLFPYEPDRDGYPVIYLRIRMHRKIKEIQEPVQHFLYFNIDRVDRECETRGCAVVFDCDGAGYSNMDLDLLRSLVDVAFKYFPFCIRFVYVYELSWMLNAFRKLAMTFVPAQLASIVRFVNKSNIHQYIDQAHLPDFMDGTCARDYREIPENCRSVMDMATEHGLDTNDVQRIMAIFKPYLEEARKAMAARRVLLIESQPTVEPIAEPENVESNPDEMATNIAVVHSPLKRFDHVAMVYPQHCLRFKAVKSKYRRFEISRRNKSYCADGFHATVMIRNNQHEKPLGFKIQSNNPERYTVTPNLGVLLPGAFVSVNISTVDTGKMIDIRDKFLVLMTTAVNLDRHLSSPARFHKLFDGEAMDKVYSHKLKVDTDESEETSEKRVKPNETESSKPESNENSGLLNEVRQLRQRCRHMERRQWLLNNVLVFLLVLLAIFSYLLLRICPESGAWFECDPRM